MEHLELAKTEINAFARKYPKLCQTDKLEALAQQAGVDLALVVVGVFAAFFTFLFAFGGARLVISLVGFVYPAYASFKAVDSSDPDDDTQWLTYWVVYACFELVEQISDTLVSWIPFYFFIKVGFLVWSWHPATQGASIIYRGVIRPHLLKHMGMLSRAEAAVETAAAVVAHKPLDTDVAAGPAKLVSQPTARAGDMGMSRLTVTLHAMRDLPKMDRFSGKADPYALIWVRPEAGRAADGAEGREHKQRSTTKPKNLNPEYNETFTLEPLPSTRATLVVEVIDAEAVGADDYCGQVEVDFEDVLASNGEPAWFTLADPENKTKALSALSGEVQLSVSLS